MTAPSKVFAYETLRPQTAIPARAPLLPAPLPRAHHREHVAHLRRRGGGGGEPPLAACSSGGIERHVGELQPSRAKVTLTWWNNANTQPLLGVCSRRHQAFEAAHPNVDDHRTSRSRTRVQDQDAARAARQQPAGHLPAVGRRQQATQVPSGKLADISADVSSWIGELGPAATSWQVNGKQYGVPYDLHVVGFWYRKDLFQQAGITSPPTTHGRSSSPTTPSSRRTASRRSRSAARTAGRTRSAGSTSPSGNAPRPRSSRRSKAST